LSWRAGARRNGNRNQNPAITADEKRQPVDNTFYGAMSQSANAGNVGFAQIDKALAKKSTKAREADPGKGPKPFQEPCVPTL